MVLVQKYDYTSAYEPALKIKGCKTLIWYVFMI